MSSNTEGGIRTNATDGADAAERLAAAHRALKADPNVQFTLAPAPPEPKAPEWLKTALRAIADVLRPVVHAIGRFFRWIDSFLPDIPFVRILFWCVLAAAAIALLWLLYLRLKEGKWRLAWRRRKAVRAEPVDAEWAPEDAPVRAWLEEADLMAQQGRFAEAVHHLLFRSIEDIGRRRPRLVRPALTSRELASAEVLPPPVRDLFSRIAALVERSLFGGRSVGAEDWQAARSAYADLVLPRSWRA